MSAILFIIPVAFATALISGVFGMAGGLVLMGALGLVFTVPEAMMLHGLIQSAANGSRAAFLIRHVDWRIFGFIGVGSLLAALVFALLTYAPSKGVLYLILGLVPAFSWLPKERLDLDASRPAQAVLCGLAVTGLNVASGVSGPLLDVFFVRGPLGRHAIVATKAAVTVFAHLVKLAYYGAPLLAAGATGDAVLERVGVLFLAALPFTLAGTWLGGRLLERFSDADFRRWTRRLVTAIGAVYVVQGVALLAG